MRNNAKRWGIALGAALLVLLALPALSGPAAAAPVAPAVTSASAGASAQWAYGGQQSANVTISVNNATYKMSAFFGWDVIFTETNTSSTTVMVEAQRTMAAKLDASLCAPNCASPTLSGSIGIHGWEQEAAFANFTLAGSVYVNGTPTTALGLINSSAYAKGALNESYSVSYTNTTGVTLTASGALKVTGHANAQIDFTPSLGLVPFNLTAGESWNSTANYTAQGMWAAVYSWTKTTFAGVTTSGSGTPSGNATGNGSVQLYGHDAGTITLKNGVTVPVLEIALVGPFDDHDGFILVPHGSDLFDASAHAWDSASIGVQTVATTKVDFDAHARGHLGFTAAATSYASSTSTVSGATLLSTGASPAASPAVGPSPTDVQAQPESVPAAQQQSACYVGSCTGTASHGFTAILLIAVVAVAVAATVGAAYVIGGRRGPQAPRPPVTVPAGAQGIAQPPSAPTPARPSPPNGPETAEDPLKHLW